MKRALLIFCCLCFLLLAQSSFAVSFGVKLGFNTSSQDFNFTQLGNLLKLNRTGAEFGVFLEFPLVTTFSISTEIRYLQKGEQFDYFSWGGNLTSPDQTSLGRLSYVSFIALAKLKIPISSFNLYGLIGPRFDFKTGPKEVVGFEILTDSYNSPIAGSVIGAGMEFKLGGVGWFLVEGYYGFDWKKLFDSSQLVIDSQTVGFLIGLRT